MNTRRSARLLMLFLAIGACSRDEGLLSPSERHTLASAQAKWNARSFPDYRYEIQRLCFCPPEINAWTRVTVRGGAVVAAEPVVPNPDPNAPPLPLMYWQPVDSLFTRILQSASGESSVYRDITVAYDQQLGFPTEIVWREKAGVADAGAVYHLRNVQPAN